MKTKPFTMPNYKRATIATALWLVLIPLLFWASGYNFDERGVTAVSCILMTIVGGGSVFFATALTTGEL